MRRFRLKFWDVQTMAYRYMKGTLGRGGSTDKSHEGWEFTTDELTHHATDPTSEYHHRCVAILGNIDSGHLTKEYV